MKQYLEAELEIIEFETEDVIATSGGDKYEGGGVNPYP